MERDPLEAILAEGSEDEDEEEDLGGVDLEQILCEEDEEDGFFQDEVDDVETYRLNNKSNAWHLGEDPLSPTSASYSAHDWALLQQILKEDDEDREEVESSIEKEQDDEPRAPIEHEPGDDQDTSAPTASLTRVVSSNSSMLASSPAAEEDDDDEPQQQQPAWASLWRISKLKAAVEREQRLVKKRATVETASPLFLKRRARAREGREAKVASRRAAASGRCAVKVETLAAVSRQLGKNAQYRAHGPGLPSALTVRSKFVAVGTSRGLTLVFDHFEEVRRVLGAASGGEDAVLCVDVSADSIVACGHASGRLVLWDVVKGSQATKAPLDFGTPLAATRFTLPRKDGSSILVGIERDGSVHKIASASLSSGTKRLWQQHSLWYNAFAECLLDESAGVSAERNLATGVGEAVFSSARTTFIASVANPVKITRKWVSSSAHIRLIAACESRIGRLLEDGVVETSKRDSTALDHRVIESAQLAEATALFFVDDRKLALVDRDRCLRVFDAAGVDESGTVTALLVVDLSSFPFLDGPGVTWYCRCEDACYLLGSNELVRVMAQSASSRVDALIEAGEWLEALALALDDDKVDDKTNLLRRYVSLAVDNAPKNSQAALSHAHFSMLASVCVEFCVETRDLDVLFGEIFASFASLDRLDAFLEALEPYIVSGKLARLAPEVMAALVAHFEKRGALVCVERCLLYLDVRALDFNMITALLKTHRLYTALFRVYSKGLDDYVTPLELLIEDASRDAASEDVRKRRVQQALLYVRYCLEGLSFPSGEESDDVGFDRLQRLRKELMLFLLQRSPVVHDKEPYGHVVFLARDEPSATLDVLTVALRLSVSSPVAVESDNPYDTQRASVVQSAKQAEPPNPDVYLRAASAALPITDAAYVDFVASHVAHRVFLNVEPEIAASVLEHLVRQNSGEATNMATMVLDALPSSVVPPLLPRLSDLAKLLGNNKALLLIDRYRATSALEVVSRGDRSPAALETAATAFREAIARYCDDRELQVFHFAALALDALLVADDEDDDADASTTHAATSRDAGADALALTFLEDALPRLAALDPVKAAELVATSLFRRNQLSKGDQQTRVLEGVVESALGGLEPHLGYSFLDALFAEAEKRQQQAMFTGPFVISRRLDFVYIELLADHAPDRVYNFLLEHPDAYSVEDCLKLCRDKGIADAQALLLEQTGDSVGALDLILATLRDRFEALREALRTANRDGRFSLSASPAFAAAVGAGGLDRFGLLSREVSSPHTTAAQRIFASGDLELAESADSIAASSSYRALRAMESLTEGRAASSILDAAVRLCRRHSEATATNVLSGHEAWFATLDQLLEAKRGLQLARELPSNASLMHAMLDDMVRRALGAMSEYVALPDIVSKLLVDHADSNLGDFRRVIVSMLQATKHETRVYGSLARLLRAEAADLRGQLAAHAEAGRKVAVLDPAPDTPAQGLDLMPVFPNPNAPPSHWIGRPMPNEQPTQQQNLRFRYVDTAYPTRIDELLAKGVALSGINALLFMPPPMEHTRADRPATVRVPGMLEARAKFYGTLPAHLGPKASADPHHPSAAALPELHSFIPAPAMASSFRS